MCISSRLEAKADVAASVADEWTAGWLSQIFFSWLGPLLAVGASRPLEETDLGELAFLDRASNPGRALEANLAREQALPHSDRSMWRAYRRTFGSFMVLPAVCKLVGDILGFVQPLALAGIVRHVEVGGKEEMGGLALGWWWAMAMFLAAVFQNVLLHQHHHWAIRAGMHARTATGAVVFRKALRLSSYSLRKAGTGEVLNLAQSDSLKIQGVFWFIAYSTAVPVQVAIAVALLWLQLGPSALVGLALMVINVFAQRYLAAYMGKRSAQAMKFADKRIGRTSELLDGIRVVKYFALEQSFLQRVDEARREELGEIQVVALINGMNGSLTDAVPVIVAVLTFLVYSFATQQSLTVSQAFSSLAIFDILRLPLLVTPLLADAISGALVAGKRLETFFDRGEVQDYVKMLPPPPGSKSTIVIKDATFTWEGSSAEATAATSPEEGEDAFSGLHVKSLELGPGLTTVVGSVGSGKSSLLAALTGEMACTSGSVEVFLPETVISAVNRQRKLAADAWERREMGLPGDHDPEDAAAAIAIVSQSPWLLGATVQDNITFGKVYDEAKFLHVVKVCRLEEDLKALPAGQWTEIGPSGNTTSGGQRARISLARAVYADAPVVLLDDVLSAVDSDVARHIFDDVLCGVLKDKTVILVSHQLQYVARSSRVIVVSKGSVSEAMSPAELEAAIEADATHPLASMFLARAQADTLLRSQAEPREAEAVEVSVGDAVAEEDAAAADTVAEEEEAAADSSPVAASPKESRSKDAMLRLGKITSEEKRTTGTVRSEVYVRYASMLGWSCLLLLLLLLSVTGSRVATDVWLSIWSVDGHVQTAGYYLSVYGAIGGGAVLLILLYEGIWACVGVRGSRLIHRSMIERVVRAPLGWFDSTPRGGLLSRAGPDLATVDKQLVQSLSRFLKTFLLILATLITQAVVQPYVLIGFAVATGYYVAMAGYYRKSSRELKRLDNITRAPVFSHFSQTLAGLKEGGLRAFGHEGRFLREAMARFDANSRAFWKLNLVNRWLGVRLDITGAVVVATTGFASVGATGTVDPGLTGLSLSFALLVVGQLNWLVRGAVDTEQFMASVERILEYADTIEPEAPWSANDTQGSKALRRYATLLEEQGNTARASVLRARALVAAPPPSWPASGSLEVKNIVMRYRPEHKTAVLKGLSFSVKSGERIGVVGRTGGGKSSLLQTLFRTVEPESGSITIDGQDVSKIGLHDLRNSLAIIPQDSVIFDASVRFNLAPGGETAHSDEEMVTALRRAQLLPKIESLGGLDTVLEGGGSSLSAGERQLLCIARAMLCKARIIVLDEATASVDSHTDSMIQKTIREAFAGRTLLTVAHRLDTIADYDKILVLVGGRVAEFGPPRELLANPDGEYSQLVAKAGSH
jgi:ATP-binding cassette, subfamily C (CFTR/MRP), member 1